MKSFRQYITERRNEIIHNALFNIKSVTKNDVELLEKIGRYFNRMREKQKRDNPELFPKLSKRQKKILKENLRSCLLWRYRFR